jgi:energy-coupling factor transporter transmembrane protein EcfT
VELAEALESRAFGATENRTSITTLQMKASDIAVIIGTIIGLALAVYVYFYVTLPTLILPFEFPPIEFPRLF